MVLEPYIDAHCHVWTPDVAHYPLGKGFTVNDMRPRSFTAEELLALCRPSGVGRVNLIQMSFYVGQGVSGKMAYEIASTYTLRDLENLIGVATDAYEWIYAQGVEPVLPSAEQGPVVTA